MRIAIVGGGVSGLVCAHLLHRTHEVMVFEARDGIGGHVNTVEVEDGAGKVQAVDTGFIVYNETTYPLFTRLLAGLGVATRPSDMSFGVRCDRTGIEYGSHSLGTLFAQRRNLLRPRFHVMLRDILRFNREAARAVRNGAADLSLGTTSPEDVVRFFENHGMLTLDDQPAWRVIDGGSARYVEALTRPWRHRIRTGHRVRRVERRHAHVVVDGEAFDHVVFACHSDQALSLLADPTSREREILGALPYQENEVVLHTDTSVLPRARRAWAAWNYRVREEPALPASVTYDMNRLQTLEASRTYCVTLNATELIDPARILYRTRYSHPVYTLEGVRAQGRRSEISGTSHTHFCGAYWGFGFHEDGVRSAVEVARGFGGQL